MFKGRRARARRRELKQKKEVAVRLIGIAAVGFLIAGSVPAMARDYPWCVQEPGFGGSLSCRFASYQQCQATVSGQGGGCTQNPAMAYGQSSGMQGGALQAGGPTDRPPRRKGKKHGWHYE
jgi:hypothetical protein